MDLNDLNHAPVNLYITHVEPEGPFVKIWGQIDKESSLFVEQFLANSATQFESDLGLMDAITLDEGMIVFAKYKDQKYYRAEVVRIRDEFLEVRFLDYGNSDLVKRSAVRNANNFPSVFKSIPPLAREFLLGEGHCPGGGDWSPATFEHVSKELLYREVQCAFLAQAVQAILVQLTLHGKCIVKTLIYNNLMQPIALQAQQGVLLSMSLIKKQTQLQNNELHTYKATTLEPGVQYAVYISYVNDGPCLFSVQLMQSEVGLGSLMKDINDMPLTYLEEVPIPGTNCLARCQEDGNICRAVVTNEVDNQFKVFFVDFGNYEVLPVESLYKIPFKFILPKIMSTRCCLAGVDKSTVTLEMKCAFKQFVDNRLLVMKVVPSATKLAISKCELWDLETKINALDVVNQAALTAYPGTVQLTRGFSQTIKVSHVFSCNRFFVQLCSEEEKLANLMVELQSTAKEPLEIVGLKEGQPCCALYENDGQWYRGEVVEMVSADSVRVKYVDYGDEGVVTSLKLSKIKVDQLTVLRPQALECCLNGYQNMQEEPTRDALLEELILEHQFTMKVVESYDKRALVELFDSSNHNVAALLLAKYAIRTSPPAVQNAKNDFSSRKSSSSSSTPPRSEPERNFNRDKKNGWNDNKSPEKGWNDAGSPSRGFKPYKETTNRYENRNSNTGAGDASSASWRDSSSKPSNNFRNNNDRYKNRENSQRRDRGPPDDQKPSWKSNGEDSWGSNSRTSPNTRDFKAQPPKEFKSQKPNFRSEKPYNSNRNSDSKSTSPKPSSIDAAGPNEQFKDQALQGRKEVQICWFLSPKQFYCQVLEGQASFKTLMNDIQLAYKGRKPESVLVNSPIIGQFPEDNVLYRARVLEVLPGQYKVLFVDFGNVSIVSKAWRIERKFMSLPVQAVSCGLDLEDASWPKAENFAKYFNKEQLVCEFLQRQDNKFIVELYAGDSNIKQQLIENGLAQGPVVQEQVQEGQFNLLFGQQFRAKVQEVQGLDNFVLAVKSGDVLNCKMHNLEEAQEKFEEVLKEFLDKEVVVYVDDVLPGDLVLVTLYNTQGQKLNIINPDEGAFDFVEPLCPFLVIRPTLRGFVSHVQENSIFLQQTNLELISKLESQSSNLTLLESPQIDQVCLVQQDKTISRAKIILLDEDQISVKLIDFGNTIIVGQDKLFLLNEDLVVFDELCLEINVKEAASSFLQKSVEVEVFFGESGWEGTVKLQEETGSQVLVTHIDSPNEFYIQLSEAQEAVEDLQNVLQEKIKDLANLESASAGVLCAAPYSVDQLWYRAQVLDADDDITTVRFVDYGNTDVIDNSSTKIKTLPQEMLSLEVYATRCTLKIKPIEEEWSDLASEEFQKLTSRTITVQFVSQDEKINYVELYSNGENVREILLKNNLALPLDLSLDTKQTCFVSHLNSPGEFWVQLENCVEELEWIAEQLSSAEAFPELEDLSPGTLCAALFPDDQMWYRARILSNTVAGLELLFIDYGNSCLASNLRQLPEELAVTAPLAQKCCLNRPQGLLYWTPEASSKFTELAADGQTVFTLRKISTGETALVELLLDEEDVSLQLIPETVPGKLVNFAGLYSFNLDQHEDKVFKLEALPGYNWLENAEDLIKLHEGKTEFQVEFLSDDFVRLYLDGADVRVEFCEKFKTPQGSPVKQLPQKVCSEVKEALQEQQDKSEAQETCKEILDNILDSGDVLEESCEKIEGVVQEKELEKTAVEVLEESSEKIEDSVQEEVEESTEVVKENEKSVEQVIESKEIAEEKESHVTAEVVEESTEEVKESEESTEEVKASEESTEEVKENEESVEQVIETKEIAEKKESHVTAEVVEDSTEEVKGSKESKEVKEREESTEEVKEREESLEEVKESEESTEEVKENEESAEQVIETKKSAEEKESHVTAEVVKENTENGQDEKDKEESTEVQDVSKVTVQLLPTMEFVPEVNSKGPLEESSPPQN